MRQLLLAAAVVTLAMSGCFRCGYGVGPLQATAPLAAGFDANQTAFHETLAGLGFTVDLDEYQTVHGRRGDEQVWVRAAANASSEVRYMLRLHHDEFPDTEAGYRQAQAYGRRQAMEAQGEVQAVHDALAAATEAPRRIVPLLEADISIC